MIDEAARPDVGRSQGPLAARQLAVEEVREAALRVSVSPFTTLFMVTSGALGRSGLVSARVASAVRGRLRARDHVALAPIDSSVARALPDAATGTLEPGTHALEDELERIAATPAETFEAEVSRLGGQTIAPGWERAAADPTGWLRSYVGALRRVWPVVEPIWTLARGLMRREVERVAVAGALGAQAELLTTVWPATRIQADRLAFDADARRWPFEVELADRRLVLIPWVGTHAHRLLGAQTSEQGRRLRDVAYTVPARAHGSGALPRPDALDGLLGAQRATILRALKRPLAMSEVADALISVPSAATRQVGVLEAADLVERSRAGQRVIVRRTQRGEELLDLYG